jgi:nucleotide-binding universal stress UspA family protein
MASFLLGTDSPSTSYRVVSYAQTRITEEDSLYAVNSLPGGDGTSESDVAEGRAALDAVTEAFPDAEQHQLIRGNEPPEDLLEFAQTHDVDELLLGITQRSPTGKLMFGSTSQDVLLAADRPVVCVPLDSR